MRRVLLFTAFALLINLTAVGQSAGPAAAQDEAALKKLRLLTEIHGLEADAQKLDKPLARALAKAEIADAAWPLEREWAQTLLREAYELTFPGEDERRRLRERQVGAALTRWSEDEQARAVIRNRVLSISRRDTAFADELARAGAESLGRYEENFRYSKLASEAVRAGDKETASRYILQSIEAEPTLVGFGFSVIELAAKDRPAADKLIIQYVERLRDFPLSLTNQSAGRVHFILRQMVFPSSNLKPELGRVPPAGPAAVRAYVAYVVESLAKLEQREPGSLRVLKGYLLSAWVPLNQYAPELAGAYLQLERLSGRPDGTPLPQAGPEEVSRERYEDRIKSAFESRQPDDLTIDFAMSRGDFEAARTLIDLLPEGERKARLVESANTREALSLVAKGSLAEAERLARQLNQALSILQVYPAMIGKCVSAQDPPCATVLALQAMKQLRRAEKDEALPLSLSRLAKAVAPADTALALEVLDEAVLAANKGGADTGLGDVGLDVNVFKELAPKSELRARQAAASLKDSLRRITATAAICQWTAAELTKKPKAASPSTPAR